MGTSRQKNVPGKEFHVANTPSIRIVADGDKQGFDNIFNCAILDVLERYE